MISFRHQSSKAIVDGLVPQSEVDIVKQIRIPKVLIPAEVAPKPTKMAVDEVRASRDSCK